MVAAHIAFGQRGEELAAQWYVQHGYTVVDRNWRCSARRDRPDRAPGPPARVAEVKARKSDAFGVPALAVGAAKQQRLRRLAAAWLAEQSRSVAASTSASTSSRSPATTSTSTRTPSDRRAGDQPAIAQTTRPTATSRHTTTNT